MNGPPPFFHRVGYGLLLLGLVLSVVAGFPVHVQPSEAADSQRVEVVVGNYFFSPRSVNVSTGVTVVWNYSGPGSDVHTVTSENETAGGIPIFASPNLLPGHTYGLVFRLPGVYLYFCAFHPTIMRDYWVNVTGPPLSDDGAPLYGMTFLVVGGIGAAAVGVIAMVLVRRRKRVLAGAGAPGPV